VARPKVTEVHCNGAVNTADQQRSVRGSIHKPSFCGLHMELTQTVLWLNAQVHNIVKQIQEFYFLCFIDCASLYNLVNKATIYS
jgi:hypothetical protein